MLEAPRYLLFDFDGVAVKAHGVFRRVISDALDYINDRIGSSILVAEFDHHLDQAFGDHGVNPDKIWINTLDELQDTYKFPPEVYGAAHAILMSSYIQAPGVYADVHLALEQIWPKYRNTMGLVTHAPERVVEGILLMDWTERKLISTKLDRFFPNPFVADVVKYKRKDVEVWRDALRFHGLSNGEGVW